MLIDTHCHLDAAEFDEDRDRTLDAARAGGVGRFVVPGVEVGNFDRIEALAAAHADIRIAFGIHPLYVTRAKEDDLAVVAERAAGSTAIAIGEIGLDRFVTDIDPKLQERYFVAQLKLARQLGLPVILHVRRAVDEVLSHLRRIEVPGGIAHAFNGSRQQADRFLALGFKLGFGGAMSFAGSRRIRRLAAELPVDAIVLETDAPDIPPAWAQGRRNEPANLARYAEILAGLRGVPLEEVVRQTTRNACDVLPGLA